MQYNANTAKYGFLLVRLIKVSIEAVFKEKHGVYCMEPYAGVDYSSPYLIVNSVVSYIYNTPKRKVKGWSGEDLSYWLSTFVSVC